MELANDRTNEENTHLFKKVGSNFQIKDRTVLFEPRGAWKTLLDSGFGGGNALVVAASRRPHFGFGNTFRKIAEAERFERSEGYPSHAFQACALDHYATPPVCLL